MLSPSHWCSLHFHALCFNMWSRFLSINKLDQIMIQDLGSIHLTLSLFFWYFALCFNLQLIFLSINDMIKVFWSSKSSSLLPFALDFLLYASTCNGLFNWGFPHQWIKNPILSSQSRSIAAFCIELKQIALICAAGFDNREPAPSIAFRESEWQELQIASLKLLGALIPSLSTIPHNEASLPLWQVGFHLIHYFYQLL